MPSLSWWYADDDGDTYGDETDSIQAFSTPEGYVSNNLDCDDTNPAVFTGATEVLDGVDNDCDGQVDEGLSSSNLRLNCGATQYISMAGDTFFTDAFFVGGGTYSNGAIPDITGDR